MNRIFTVIFITIALSATLRQGECESLTFDTMPVIDSKSNEADHVEQTLKQMEAELLDAFLKADTERLGRLWAEEFTFTAPNGQVVTRENYLALLKSGSVKYDFLELKDVKVRVYGDTATASGRVAVRGKVGAHILNGEDRYLTVYVKREGRWQQVATHASRIAQQPAQ